MTPQVEKENRAFYIEKCKQEFIKFKQNNKLIIHYVSNNNNQRVGVLLAAKVGEEPIVGWSVCNVKKGDKFNKYIGLAKAIRKLGGTEVDLEGYPKFPNRIAKSLRKSNFIERVEKYFKVDLSS